MKNLVGIADGYFDFVVGYEAYRTPEYFVDCLADTAVNYWRTLLFVPADGTDHDDATKAEESLIYSIRTDFSDTEKAALQKAAQRQLEQRFPGQENIAPEDESLPRERRFLTFIADGRFEDMDLL
jgi:hypothetical protein